MKTKKKLTRKVEISQGGKSVTFRLSEKEYQSLRRSSRHTAREPIPTIFGDCYNFAMYSFFEYETSSSKSGRFNKEFNYHNGDFTWLLITE